jgi:hypothetical protein
MYLTNHSVSGTITNLAPERMLVRGRGLLSVRGVIKQCMPVYVGT